MLDPITMPFIVFFGVLLLALIGAREIVRFFLEER